MPLLSRLTALLLLMGAAAMPARAFDLQYRQNGTSFSPSQLRALFTAALPVDYDRQFSDQRWTTYLLLDAHREKGLVAITLGLSPRLDATRALLPVASFSVIEPLPGSPSQWQQLLSQVTGRYAQAMLENRSRILMQR